MDMLEKFSLVEKVDKDNLNYANLNKETNIETVEVLEDEDNSLEVKDIDYEKEIIVPEQEMKEKSSSINMEYENKIMIDEIYSLYGLEKSNINTVFMLQKLINALPKNLPQDVVKQSVMNIIDASNINLNDLLSDGEQRLESLIKVMDGYHNKSNKLISDYKEEIVKLTDLINNCQKQIKNKETMLEEQNNLVKYETQKIQSIMDFFRN
jgi:hypothetical protein